MSAPIAKRIGMLTPSSNTVLEPLTTAMLQDVPDVSAHFGRFRVLKISLDADALNQFSTAPMLDAASMHRRCKGAYNLLERYIFRVAWF